MEKFKQKHSKKKTTTKIQLVQAIAKDKNLEPRDVRQIVQAFLDQITFHLSMGKRFEFREFGIFETVKRKPKIGRNPKQADIPIVIPARTTVKFTQGKKLKDAFKPI